MHYMIFVPQAALPENKAGDAKAVLAHVGLADICDGSPVLSPVVDHGPNGGPGVLISWGKAGFVKLHEQLWRNVPGHSYCVGTGLDGLTSPGALNRRNYAGYDVKLGDGQVWRIPTAHAFPESYVLKEDGTVGSELQGEFNEFFNYTYDVAWQHWLVNGEDVDFTELCRYCARAMAFNYRITYEIALTLGLFNKSCCQEIIEATCDVPAMVRAEEQKKTAKSQED